MRNKIFLVLSTALAFVAIFGGISHAATAAEQVTGGSAWDLLTPLYQAFAHGQYVYAGSMAIVVIVAAARRYGTAKYVGDGLARWIASDEGSTILAFAFSLASTMIVQSAGGTSAVTWSGAWHATTIAVGAVGGYAVIRRLVIKPYLARLAGRGPAWLHKPLDFVLWIFATTEEQRAVTTSMKQPAPSAGQ
jgi:hypothetical protein